MIAAEQAPGLRIPDRHRLPRRIDSPERGISRPEKPGAVALGSGEYSQRGIMRKIWSACLLITALALPALPALADEYSDTVTLFKNAGASATYLNSTYGYAVF